MNMFREIKRNLNNTEKWIFKIIPNKTRKVYVIQRNDFVNGLDGKYILALDTSFNANGDLFYPYSSKPLTTGQIQDAFCNGKKYRDVDFEYDLFLT